MRNKKTLLLVFGFIIFSSYLPIKSQENEKELLKNYVLPDIQRHSMDFMFNSGGDFKTHSASPYGSNMENVSNIGGTINGNYNYRKITRRFIGEQNFQFGFQANYQKFKYWINEEEDYREKSSINPSFEYTNKSRFYLNTTLFIETGGNISFNNQRYYEDNDFNERNINGYIPLIIGIGRIENVEDMRQAIYITNKLVKNNTLSSKLTDSQMIEFASLISTVKNKRFFDSRKKLISEITSLDSFLVSNNLLEKNGAEYFTTLYDYWQYGALFERKNGTEWKIGFKPEGRNLYHKSFGDNKIEYNSFNLIGSLSFSYENPINLYWQNSAMIDINGGRRNSWYKYKRLNEATNHKNDIKTNFMDINGSYYFSYYPNSRTHLQMGISEYFIYNKIMNERDNSFPEYSYNEENTYEYNASITRLHLNTYYYISPQLRLMANANIGYRKVSKDNMGYPGYMIWDDSFMNSKRSWIGDFAIGFTYSLF